jgi:hypothetical protein
MALITELLNSLLDIIFNVIKAFIGGFYFIIIGLFAVLFIAKLFRYAAATLGGKPR